MAETLHIPLKFPITSGAGKAINKLPVRRLKRKDIAAAQKHSKDDAVIEDHLLARMTGLTLEELYELDIADNKVVVEVFREMASGGDGSAVLGRSPAIGAADAAE